MQQDVHIVISVKDFKAVVTHAETLRGSLSAYFSHPGRPLQFAYQNFGMTCEFTLMTTSDWRAASSTPTSNPKFTSNRSLSRQPSVTPYPPLSRSMTEMMPPPRPTLGKAPSVGESHPKVPAIETQDTQDADPESLFIPGGDDADQVWQEPDYDQDDGEEMLGWDASNEHPSASFHQTFRDGGESVKPQHTRRSIPQPSQEGLEPTQRLSQVSMAYCAERMGTDTHISSMGCLIERCYSLFNQALPGSRSPQSQ
jgi:cell cycle checkpoint control protein RAD9A